MAFSPAQIIRKLLLDTVLAGEFSAEEFSSDDFNTAWPCYVGSMPDNPNECICVIDTGSLKDGRLLRTGEVIEHPACQIQIRARKFSTGWGKGKLIQDKVDSVVKATVVMDADTTETIHAISRAQSLLYIGTETSTTKRRQLFTLNITITL